MIGFFDSGFGGLQTMKNFYKLFPNYDYIYFGDTKNCPYGIKKGDDIKKLTFGGLRWLFDNGAKIVIIACNTAAAYSIRSRQKQYPNKKTLSISIPGIQELLKYNIYNNTSIIATKATIESKIYDELFYKFGGKINPNFNYICASELVNLVESGNINNIGTEQTIKKYTDKIRKNDSILILGCTHFPILINYFTKNFLGQIIDPSEIASIKFVEYINNHPEIEKTISKNGTINIYTSGSKNNFDKIGSNILGKSISSKQIKIF